MGHCLAKQKHCLEKSVLSFYLTFNRGFYHLRVKQLLSNYSMRKQNKHHYPPPKKHEIAKIPADNIAHLTLSSSNVIFIMGTMPFLV